MGGIMKVYIRISKLRIIETLLFVLMTHLSFVVYSASSPYAETVILNGKVITADSDDPEAVSIEEAIAISGDKIIAVGSNDDIQEMIADWTEVIDAKGNSVIPGLIDTHNHLFETALGFDWVVKRIPEMLEISVRADSVEGITLRVEQAVAARANQIPEGRWIMVDMRPPEFAVETLGKTITREKLDNITSNHPVFVSTRGGSVLNSMAIEAVESYYGNQLADAYWKVDRELGWSGDYTDFGRCIKIDLINSAFNTLDKYIQGYFEVMQANAQIGVTTHKSHIQCELGFSATNHLDRNGLMPIRMAYGHRWMQPFNPRIKETYRRIGDWTGHGSQYLWSIGSSTGGQDAGGVAWCTSMPAEDSVKQRELCPPPPPGVDVPGITEMNTSVIKVRRVEHFTTLADLAAEGRITGIPGWHTAGDAALEMQFKYFRKVMSDERLRSLRIASDHCHLVTPEEIQIAARLGHTFSCDITSTPTQVIKKDYGEEYLAWTTPVASMLKAGVNTVISEFGSQRVVRKSPFEDGVVWMTGKTMDGETWGVPEEVVPDRMTLLLMMTRYGGYPLWKEDTLGSIEPGKLADIVILNGDYMEGPKEELDQLTSIMTLVSGKAVFEDPALRGNTFRFDTSVAEWIVDMNTPTDIWRWQEAPKIPPFLNGAGGFN
jgi:predicted amidohydrolase YtcJ